VQQCASKGNVTKIQCILLCISRQRGWHVFASCGQGVCLRAAAKLPQHHFPQISCIQFITAHSARSGRRQNSSTAPCTTGKRSACLKMLLTTLRTTSDAATLRTSALTRSAARLDRVAPLTGHLCPVLAYHVACLYSVSLPVV